MLAINGFEYEAKDRREINQSWCYCRDPSWQEEIYRRWGVKLVSGV